MGINSLSSRTKDKNSTPKKNKNKNKSPANHKERLTIAAEKIAPKATNTIQIPTADMKINRPVVAPVLQPKKTLKNRINNLKNNIRDKVLGLKQVSQKDSPEGELTKGKNPVQTKLVEIGSKLQDTYDRLAMTGDLQVIDPNCCDDETMDGFIDDFISLDTGDRPEPMDKYKDPLGKRIITALENGIKVVESVVDDKLGERGTLLEISTKYPDILKALVARVQARITQVIATNAGQKPTDDIYKLTKLQIRLKKWSDKTNTQSTISPDKSTHNNYAEGIIASD